MDPSFIALEFNARHNDALVRYLAEFQTREMLGLPQQVSVPDFLDKYICHSKNTTNEEPAKHE